MESEVDRALGSSSVTCWLYLPVISLLFPHVSRLCLQRSASLIITTWLPAHTRACFPQTLPFNPLYQFWQFASHGGKTVSGLILYDDDLSRNYSLALYPHPSYFPIEFSYLGHLEPALFSCNAFMKFFSLKKSSLHGLLDLELYRKEYSSVS